MNLNFAPINFKGYDALPLKAVHIEEYTSSPIEYELKQIAQNEGFEIRSGLDYCKWAQDFKMIIEKNKKPFIVANYNVGEDYLNQMQSKYGIPSATNPFIATGGNTFIGKYPNGEKWMLIGIDELDTKSPEYISQEYGVKKENIFPIPQQNYHLDMFMRPIGFPYILVDNPELSKKKLASLDIKSSPIDYLNLNKNFKDYETARSKNYASHTKVIKALQKAGFKPIEIAGVFGSGINFMNAIVNQHPDKKISYITNGTQCDSEFISKLQDEFEKDLRQKIPNLDEVYFINGSEEYKVEDSNYMMDNLAYRGGGIHCMTMEEPDFETWG